MTMPFYKKIILGFFMVGWIGLLAGCVNTLIPQTQTISASSSSQRVLLTDLTQPAETRTYLRPEGGVC